MSRNKRQKSLVTLTPLIDVVFILLLFFMLTTQFNSLQATRIEVTAGNQNTITTANSDVLGIRLLAGREVTINGSLTVSLSSSALDSRLLEAAREGQEVNVRFDDDSTVQELTELTDLLYETGIQSEKLTLKLF